MGSPLFPCYCPTSSLPYAPSSPTHRPFSTKLLSSSFPPFLIVPFSDLGVVHCDIKPANIMSAHSTRHRHRHLPADGPGVGGVGSAPRLASAPEGEEEGVRWSLIDFGTSFTLNSSLDVGRRPDAEGKGMEGSDFTCLHPLPSLNRTLTSPPSPDAAEPLHYAYRTVSYCPPEAALGIDLPPSPGYDLWSLACVAYEAATGSKLFDVAAAAGGRDSSRAGDAAAAAAVSGVGRFGGDRGDIDEEDRLLLRLIVETIGPAPEQVCDAAEQVCDAPEQVCDAAEQVFHMPCCAYCVCTLGHPG